MAEIATILIRKGTAAQWAAANPILNNGEPGYVTDTGRIKIGDGSTAFSNLPYADTRIPDASNTSKGLMTAAQAAQVNTNKANISTLTTTVEGHGTRITNAENTLSTQGNNINTLLNTLPKANCVRLMLNPSGEEVKVYNGNTDYLLYCAIDGIPHNPHIAVKLDGNTTRCVDFIFKDTAYPGTIPEKAFFNLNFTISTKAILVIPNYITYIDNSAIIDTQFEYIVSHAVEPPRIVRGRPTVTKVFVPKIVKSLYENATIWDNLLIDEINNM